MTLKKPSTHDVWYSIIAVLLSIISFYEVKNYNRWDAEITSTKTINRKQDSMLIREQLIYELQIKPSVKRSFKNEKDIGAVKIDVENIKSRIK